MRCFLFLLSLLHSIKPVFDISKVPGLKEESWREAVAAYARGVTLTGMQVVIEGAPLDMRNPWDEPEAEPEAGP